MAKWALTILGFTSLALGILGIFLPLLPTTVFILIAAWAFSRSSERVHGWLINHPLFGPPIQSWNRHHAMPRRYKRITFVILTISYACMAIVFGPLSMAALIGGACLAGVAIYIGHIPVLAEEQSRGLARSKY